MACPEGQYYCHDRGKCMPIPKGKKVRKDGELVSEVAPPGWGHTKAEKEKTKPDKPKSKIGGTIAAMKRAQDRGDIPKKLNIFALAYSMKNKGAKPHYKPGTDEKYKKYQEEQTSMKDNNLFGNAYAGSIKKKKNKNIKEEPERTAEYKAMQASLYPRGDAEGATAHRVGGWKKKRPRNVTTKRNRGYRKPAGARVHEESAIEENKFVKAMVDAVRKKKEERKPEKAMDAGARAKRRLARKVHRSTVSDFVPKELEDHKTWSDFRKHI